MSGIVDQIVKFGKATCLVLGISFASEQSVEQFSVSGVLVLDAPPNGPVGKAVSSHYVFRRILAKLDVAKIWFL